MTVVWTIDTYICVHINVHICFNIQNYTSWQSKSKNLILAKFIAISSKAVVAVTKNIQRRSRVNIKELGIKECYQLSPWMLMIRSDGVHYTNLEGKRESGPMQISKHLVTPTLHSFDSTNILWIFLCARKCSWNLWTHKSSKHSGCWQSWKVLYSSSSLWGNMEECRFPNQWWLVALWMPNK